MPITLEKIEAFLTSWFECVGHGGTAEEQAAFHLHPDTRVYTGTGLALTLKEHHQLHQNWTDEKHALGTLTLTKVNDDPERVRVDGMVYWGAKNKGETNENARIQTAVDESWIIEQTPSGLKFVLYISKSFMLLPGSAVPTFIGK